MRARQPLVRVNFARCIQLLVLVQTIVQAQREMVSAEHPDISYANGRFYHAGPDEVYFDWIGSEISIAFSGSASVFALLSSHAVFNVAVDGVVATVLACTGANVYELAAGLDLMSRHNITVTLRTEAKVSNRTTPLRDTPSKFRGFMLDKGGLVRPVVRNFSGKLVVVGDSISAGWGNTGRCCGQPGARSDPCAEDGTQSYGALVARQLNLEVHLLASGGSGFGTGPPNGPRGNRTGVDWTEPSMDKAMFRQLQFAPSAGPTNLSAFVADYLVVNIGTNDNPKLGTEWEEIYVDVLKRLRSAWGRKTWFLLGCAPWQAYSAEIESVVDKFADPANRTIHLDWGDFKSIERGCFEHPSIRGHRTMANSVVDAITALRNN